MTTLDVFDIIDEKVGQAAADINGENPHYLHDFLIKSVRTANFWLLSHNVITGVTVDVSAENINPDPFDDLIGLMLAYGASSNVIDDDLVQRVRAGEMGLSFRTAVSEITTNQAAITLSSSARNLRSDFERLIQLHLGRNDALSSRLQ